MTCARPARTGRPARSSPPMARPSRSRTRGSPPGRRSTQSIWTDHTALTGPQFQNTDINPGGYPFFTGKVAMATNYLWSLYGDQGRGRRLEHGGHAVVPRPDHGRVQCRYVPHPQVEQASGRGVQDADVPPRRTRTCSSSTAACPRSSRSRTRSCSPCRRTTRSRSTGTSPRKASSSLTCRTSSRTPRPTTRRCDLLTKFYTKWQATPGLDIDAEVADLKTQMQAIWDAGGN